MVVDEEGKEIEEVDCPKNCKDSIPPYTEEKVEERAPGQVHSTYSTCSVCNGSGKIWRRKEKSVV